MSIDISLEIFECAIIHLKLNYSSVIIQNKVVHGQWIWELFFTLRNYLIGSLPARMPRKLRQEVFGPHVDNWHVMRSNVNIINILWTPFKWWIQKRRNISIPFWMHGKKGWFNWIELIHAKHWRYHFWMKSLVWINGRWLTWFAWKQTKMYFFVFTTADVVMKY